MPKRLPSPPKPKRPDGDSAAAVAPRVQVLARLREKRALRDALMDMARTASAGQPAVLLLPEPLLSDDALKKEWVAAAAVFKPEVLSRLQMVTRRKGALNGWPQPPSPAEHARWNEEFSKVESNGGVPRPVRRAEAFYDILRVLIRHWMLRSGSVAQGTLAAEAGCSYPTLAAALKKLDAVLKWETARRVYLTRFPKREWERLVVLSHEVRGTRYFHLADTAPAARAALAGRITALQRDDIALGGVPGARHFFPSLDITAPPQVDVTVKATGASADLQWTSELGLKDARPQDRAALAVHFLTMPADGFERANGILHADPVECLLDLHEMRLEAQAKDFLEHFQRLYE